jgi:hypothetical protein
LKSCHGERGWIVDSKNPRATETTFAIIETFAKVRALI